jgi:NADH-quinone oxidoreductase subunit C
MKLSEVEKKIRENLSEAVFKEADPKFGVTWSVELPLDKIRDCARVFDGAGFFLETLTALDFEDSFELVYHFNTYEPGSRAAVRAMCGHGQPAPTLCDIFSAAGWLEREVHEFFGISFAGNPDLRPLLLPEDVEPDYNPLRKTFGKTNAYRKREEIYG